MKKILVPTDFSIQAQNALNVALQIAKRFNSEILLLHTIDLPLHLSSVGSSQLPEPLFFIELAKQHFEQFLEKIESNDISIKTIIESDYTASGIVEASKKHNADLIVMGSSGATGMKEIFIGSNTEKVVRSAEIPVLVIKNPVANFNIEHFVFASNFEPKFNDAFMRASLFAEKFHAKIHLLYVNTPHQFMTTHEIEEKIEKFKRLNATQDDQVHIYNDERVETGIMNFATSIDADMICMSTYGRKGLAHFFNGSISEDLVNHTIRPVLTIRA